MVQPLFAALLALASLAAADTVEYRAAAASPFQYAPAPARVAALGANPALPGGVDMLSVNPAVLAYDKGRELSLDAGTYPGGIQRQQVGLGLGLGAWGGLGLGLGTVDYGSIEVLDEQGRSLGDAGIRDLGLDLGWGKDWEGLGLGVQGSLRREDLAGSVAWTPFTGLGVALGLPGDWRLGLNWLQPVGVPGDFGVASAGMAGPVLAWSHWGLAAGLRPGQSFVQLSAALRPLKALELRAGQRWSFPDQRLGALGGLSAGAGFVLQTWKFDYAWVPLGELGSVHQISLGLDLGRSGPRLSSTVTPAPSPTPLVTVPTPLAAPRLELQIASPQFTAGLDLERQGRLSEAVAAYHAVLGQEPQNQAAWRALARVYERLGRPDYARRCHQRLLELDPGDQEAQAWLQAHPSP